MAEDWDHQKMLDLYILDYFTKRKLYTTATKFAQETNLEFGQPVAIITPEGFLGEWWSIFSDMYRAREQARAQNASNGEEHIISPPELKGQRVKAVGLLSQYKNNEHAWLDEPSQIQNAPNQMFQDNAPEQQNNNDYYSEGGLSITDIWDNNKLGDINLQPHWSNVGLPAVKNSVPAHQHWEHNDDHAEDPMIPQHPTNVHELLNHPDPAVQVAARNMLMRDPNKSQTAQNQKTTLLSGKNKQKDENELSALMPPPRQTYGNQPESEEVTKQKTDNVSSM